MLPSLLAAVRWRRRRRHAARAAAALVLVGAGFWWWPAAPTRPPERGLPVAAAQRWTEVGDDPTVLARCERHVPVRAQWFVDDVGLHDLLADAQRDAGLVRAGARVFVSATAVDDWGAAESP